MTTIDAIKARLDKAESDAYGNADGFDPDLANSGLSVREVRIIIAQLSASQQRERAMLSDMAHEMECGACCHARVDVCDEPCASCRRENSKFKWRGPQTAKEETKQ